MKEYFSAFFWGHLPFFKSAAVAAVIVSAGLLLRGPVLHAAFGMIRRLFSGARTKLPSLLAEACERPARAGALALTLYAACAALRTGADRFDSALHTAALGLLRITAIVLLTWAAARFIGPELFETVFPGRGDEKMTRTFRLFFSRILRVGVAALGAVIVISELGYDIGGLLAGLGLGGLTVALAAQDWASNLFGGIVILFDRPFAVGDWIQVESGMEGTVEDITFRTTRVRTFDNSQASIPNALLVSKTITNWSRMQKRKIAFDFGLTYDTPMDKLEQCAARLRQSLEETPEVHPDVVSVTFSALGECAFMISVYCFTTLTGYVDYMRVKEQILRDTVGVVEELGLSFAFPTRTVFLENTNK